MCFCLQPNYPVQEALVILLLIFWFSKLVYVKINYYTSAKKQMCIEGKDAGSKYYIFYLQLLPPLAFISHALMIIVLNIMHSCLCRLVFAVYAASMSSVCKLWLNSRCWLGMNFLSSAMNVLHIVCVCVCEWIFECSYRSRFFMCVFSDAF